MRCRCSAFWLCGSAVALRVSADWLLVCRDWLRVPRSCAANDVFPGMEKEKAARCADGLSVVWISFCLIPDVL